MEKLKELLGELCSKKIIEKVKSSVNCKIAYLIVIEKSDKSLNYFGFHRDVNKNVVRETVEISVIDSIG